MWRFMCFCQFSTSVSGCCYLNLGGTSGGSFFLPSPRISDSLYFSFWQGLILSFFFLSFFSSASFAPLVWRYDYVLSTSRQRGDFSIQPSGIIPVSSTIFLLTENQNQGLYANYRRRLWGWLRIQCHKNVQHPFGHVPQRLWWTRWWCSWWTSIGCTAAWYLHQIFEWKRIPQWTWKFSIHWAAPQRWIGLWFWCPLPWGICH